MPTNIPTASRASAPTPAATPIPAFAAVLRPGEGFGGGVSVAAAAEVVAAVLEVLEDAAVEEVEEVVVVVAFDLIMNARLDS